LWIIFQKWCCHCKHLVILHFLRFIKPDGKKSNNIGTTKNFSVGRDLYNSLIKKQSNMRYFVFLFFLVYVGCASTYTKQTNIHSNGIVYLLPSKVLLNLKKQNLECDSFFTLTSIDETSFRIYLQKFNKKNNWLKNTNRFIAIDGVLYPLLFEFDNYFANIETAGEFLDNYKKEIYQKTSVSYLREDAYHVDFNLSGEILYEGW